tara:strand:+ start:37 stop:624 length:588 start_codon:yes stop_codon:yes gene_type:complete
MPRKRKLSIEEAIEKSMFAFWQYGFGLGVRSLEEKTGINRFMLQTELGGKEGLFIKALDAYLAKMEKDLFLPIASGNLDTIVELLKKQFNDNRKPMACHGCFAVNTISDENAVSEEIERRRRRFMDLSLKSFISALQNEQKNNRLKKNLNIGKTASFLTASIFGINILDKIKNNNSHSRPAMEMLVQQIMSWRKT